MSRFQAMPTPALVAATNAGRIKKRAGLPKLLHKLFIKVLRLRAAPDEPPMRAAFEACFGYRMGSDDQEYCYYYSYDDDDSRAGSSWAGVLSSIPEEEVDYDHDDSSEEDVDVAPAVLPNAKSERFVVGSPEAATVVRVEVLL